MFHSTLGRALLLGAGAAVAAAAAVAAVVYGQMKKELRSEAEDFEDEVSGKNCCEGTTEIDEKECCCGEKQFTEPTAVNDGAVAYDTTGDGKADTVCIDTDGDGQIDTVLTDTTGDGELEEGQNWEALMFAGSKHVDNLIVTVDYNKKQIDGSTDSVMSLGNLRAKFAAFQWLVLDMNGNDMKSCIQTLKLAKTLAGNQKPIAILMKTEMGQGVDFMMGTHKWHGTPPNDEQAAAALAQLPETLGDY